MFQWKKFKKQLLPTADGKDSNKRVASAILQVDTSNNEKNG